jgi:hypothetical protein
LATTFFKIITSVLNGRASLNIFAEHANLGAKNYLCISFRSIIPQRFGYEFGQHSGIVYMYLLYMYMLSFTHINAESFTDVLRAILNFTPAPRGEEWRGEQ